MAESFNKAIKIKLYLLTRIRMLQFLLNLNYFQILGTAIYWLLRRMRQCLVVNFTAGTVQTNMKRSKANKLPLITI